MKTFLLTIALSFFSASHTANYVYICTGPKATVYYSTENCSGLNRCSGSIKKVTETQAKNMGRRRCKKCY